MKNLDSGYAHKHPLTIPDRRFRREVMANRRAIRIPARLWPALAANPAALGRLHKTPLCRNHARRLAALHCSATPESQLDTASLFEIHAAANAFGRLLDGPEAQAVRDEFAARVIPLEAFQAFAAEFGLGRPPTAREQTEIDSGLVVADGVVVIDDRWGPATVRA